MQLGFRLLSVAEHGRATGAVDAHDLHDSAQALLDGQLTVPAVNWEPEGSAEAAPNPAEVPLHLRILLHHCSPSFKQLPQEQAEEQRGTSLLGDAVILGDGSDWLFCSHDCAGIAWLAWAAALSPGPQGQLPEPVKSCSFVETFSQAKMTPQVKHACSAGGGLDAFPLMPAGPSSSCNRCAMPAWLPESADADAVREFYEHAAGSNDIFRVAARAVALAGSAACMFEAACEAGVCQASCRAQGMDAHAAAVQFAWQPFKAIAKAVWWEHVPMPAELEDEQAWRADLRCEAVPFALGEARAGYGAVQHKGDGVVGCREMACDSLGLLKAALPGSFPQEFLHERIWGSLVGMFELNNLDLQVQSPLELFFLACDDLPEPQRAVALRQTSKWLDALDTEYDACVEVLRLTGHAHT